ncbi:hypothetical protein L1987_01702 [Smallanthus sonchifolius]|uniref:Uncharacterized protein n=1 Tax=Smallanthus sonchifolius TaxID=185202 RepID=A0ACB9K5U6_9ASTR|nr:hypothetical protein L1987_01702 [Smallanthus sonchifolius]
MGAVGNLRRRLPGAGLFYQPWKALEKPRGYWKGCQFIGMTNKKRKKGAAKEKNVARKEETHDRDETRREAEEGKRKSKDLAGSLNKRMADMEASITQLKILVDGSLEKLETLRKLQAELHRLREDFKVVVEVIRLEMQAMIKKSNHENGGGVKSDRKRKRNSHKEASHQERGCFLCNGKHQARYYQKKNHLHAMVAHKKDHIKNNLQRPWELLEIFGDVHLDLDILAAMEDFRKAKRSLERG